MKKRRFIEERPILSTVITITAISDIGTTATSDIINEAFNKFDYVAKKFSRFDKQSELSQLNTSNGKPFHASKELFDLVDFALGISKITSNAYDPTIIDLLEMYGYKVNSDFSRLYEADFYNEITNYVKHRPAPSQIKLNKQENIITLARNQRLDLGSIGKGYAIDLAFSVLDAKLDSFIINAGGDIRAKGVKENGLPWIASMAKELFPNSGLSKNSDEEWGRVELNNSALAASGRMERKVGAFHHIIEPRTGLPSNITHQTFVLADTALLADAWSTALFVLGTDGIKILPKNNSVKVLIIDALGKMVYNSSFFVLA